MVGTETRESPASEKIAVAVILLTAALVRLPGLGESLWFDEIFYTIPTFEQPAKLLFLLAGDVHPPLYALVLLGWTTLFGDSEISVRLPSFIFGMISLFLIWTMARRWFGNRLAILALVFLTLSPPHIWHSHENKANMLLLLLCTAAVWFYWRASECNATRDWVLATVCLILSLWTHAFALPVACAIALWIAWRAWEEQWLLKPVLYSALTVGLAWGPLALFKLSQGGKLARGYLRPLTLEELYKFLLVWLPHGNTIRTINPYSSFAKLAAQPWPYFLVDGFFAVLLVWGLVQAWRRACGGRGVVRELACASICKTLKRGEDSGEDSERSPNEKGSGIPGTRPSSETWSTRLLLFWFILPVVLTLAGSLVIRKFYIERNLLILLAPYAIIMALAVNGHRHRAVKSASTGLFLVLSVLAVWNLLVTKADLWTVYKLKPDWRSAAEYLGGEVEKDGDVLLITTNPTNELSYYGRRMIRRRQLSGLSLPKFLMVDFCSSGPQKALQAAWEKNLKSFYLIWNKTWNDCFNNAQAAFSQDPRFRLSGTREFKGLTIYKYEIVRPADLSNRK